VSALTATAGAPQGQGLPVGRRASLSPPSSPPSALGMATATTGWSRWDLWAPALPGLLRVLHAVIAREAEADLIDPYPTPVGPRYALTPRYALVPQLPCWFPAGHAAPAWPCALIPLLRREHSEMVEAEEAFLRAALAKAGEHGVRLLPPSSHAYVANLSSLTGDACRVSAA
jgi:hypothetical protein